MEGLVLSSFFTQKLLVLLPFIGHMTKTYKYLGGGPILKFDRRIFVQDNLKLVTLRKKVTSTVDQYVLKLNHFLFQISSGRTTSPAELRKSQKKEKLCSARGHHPVQRQAHRDNHDRPPPSSTASAGRVFAPPQDVPRQQDGPAAPVRQRVQGTPRPQRLLQEAGLGSTISGSKRKCALREQLPSSSQS